MEELNECAERSFGDKAHHMVDSLLYAKLPPHLKRSLNLAYLENGTYDQMVAHLEREFELSGLENDGELTIPTMTAVPPNDNQQNTEQTKIVFHYCKKPGHVIRDFRKKIRKEQEQRTDPSIQNLKPNKPKQFKQEYPIDNPNDGQEQGNLTHSGPSPILKNSLNEKSYDSKGQITHQLDNMFFLTHLL